VLHCKKHSNSRREAILLSYTESLYPPDNECRTVLAVSIALDLARFLLWRSLVVVVVVVVVESAFLVSLLELAMNPSKRQRIHDCCGLPHEASFSSWR